MMASSYSLWFRRRFPSSNHSLELDSLDSLANDSSGLRVAGGSTTSFWLSKNRYISVISDYQIRATLKSTNHDVLAGIGVVDNPESVLRPGKGNIETFKL